MPIIPSSNRKISFLLLSLVFIGLSMTLFSCDSISEDTKNNIEDWVQGLEDSFKQVLPQLETELEQANIQFSPPIATVENIWADFSVYRHFTYVLSVSLKPTSLTIANKEYAADLYEKGVFRERVSVSWNQPELNVLKEQVISFHSNRQENNAYSGKDISHIFSVKVHE